MRSFAASFHRQMIVGFAGDAAPADPMAAGLTWEVPLARPDRPERPARTFQAYYRTNAAITCSFQLWLHGAGANWVAVYSPIATLAAVPPLRAFEFPGKLDDSLVFLRVTPSLALGAGETIDLYAEGVDLVEEVGVPIVGLRLVP